MLVMAVILWLIDNIDNFSANNAEVLGRFVRFIRKEGDKQCAVRHKGCGI